MSGGGPPHHSHNRQVPAANTAWNHLQVPNFFPRQPQVAHMSTEQHLLHQPTWHTPTTTEAMKILPHTHMLSEMLKNESLFPRDCVDLSLTRNGNQNGELPTTPISLSVRDTNKINSLPPSVLDIQAVELTKCTSPGLKSVSPGLKSSISPGLKSSSPSVKSASPSHKSHSPAPKSSSPGLLTTSALPAAAGFAVDSGKNQKRSNIRVDSILERLNPTAEKVFSCQEPKSEATVTSKTETCVTSKSEKSSSNKQIESNKPEVKQTESPATSKTEPPAISKSDTPSTTRVEDIVATLMKSDLVVTSKTDTIVPTKTDVPVAAPNLESEKIASEKCPASNHGVIIQPVGAYDENSNSSSIANVPTPTNVKEDDSASMHSNEDSLDSTKSRRKRKPSKTVRVSKEDEPRSDKDKVTMEASSTEEPTTVVKPEDKDPITISSILEGTKIPERRHSSDDLEVMIPAKTRRKASSESETIDNIAAMVQEGLLEKQKSIASKGVEETPKEEEDEKLDPIPEKTPPAPPSDAPVSQQATVSVIKAKDHLEDALAETLSGNDAETEIPAAVSSTANEVAPPETASTGPVMTAAQKKATNTHFVEVENKLEEMFAGIVEEPTDPLSTTSDPLSNDPLKEEGLCLADKLDVEDSLTKLEDSVTSTSQELAEVASTSGKPKKEKKATPKKAKRSRTGSSRGSDASTEVTPKKKRFTKKKSSVKAKRGLKSPAGALPAAAKSKKPPAQASSQPNSTQKSTLKGVDTGKDVYAYDSGSNASSSRSRGPFVQIKGPRDSPISVNVVNAPQAGDDDGERKPIKSKKFHDDSEYRHKVRSKGLHCSTLSNKYDAQTKDASWICAFCKRGPHTRDSMGLAAVSEALPPGDLFGPYFITTQCPEFERRLDDPYDRQFKSKKIGKALDGTSATLPPKPKKSKRKHSESTDASDIYLGITSTGPDTYEVWVHEDCLVWSQGVCLVGPKLIGLEEAVWTSCNVPCSVCNLKGANICCLKRGCLNMAHLCCARGSLWRFDEKVFRVYCPEHAFL